MIDFLSDHRSDPRCTVARTYCGAQFQTTQKQRDTVETNRCPSRIAAVEGSRRAYSGNLQAAASHDVAMCPYRN